MGRIISILLLLTSINAEAKWANLADASTETQLYNTELKVNKDGTSEEIIERKIKILNERGRKNIASYRMYYNGDSSKIKILEAYTTYQGIKYPVDMKKIEDKPLASNSEGFDQQRQIFLSFLKAEIGAEIYLKHSEKTMKTVLPGLFRNGISFNGGCYKHAHLKITSQLPLYPEVNDPNKALNIKQENRNGLHHLDMNLTKPICEEVVDGSEIGSINDNKYTWMLVSSLDSWKDFAKQTAVRYEKVINQPLPELFSPILEAAKLEKDEISQLNLITSMINDKVRYMGNWVSIDGAYYPRDLSLIAKLQEADCKEFSSLTASILRKLGYKAQVALVTRGEGEMSFVRKYPQLNHAFLKVTNKSGKVYWLDPTNIVSMAQGVFPDVANKMSLVLDLNEPSYERSTNIDSTHSSITFKDHLDITGGKVIHSGQLSLTGESSLMLTAQELFNTKETIQDLIFHSLSNDNLPKANKLEMSLPDLHSRIVKDLNVTFKYSKDNELLKTNIGYALKLPASWSNEILNYVPNQLSDIYIGPKRTSRKSMIINNIKISKIENLNYQIDTPWISVKRYCSINGNNSEIKDTIVIKKDFITSEELSSAEYNRLKNGIEKSIKDVAVVLE